MKRSTVPQSVKFALAAAIVACIVSSASAQNALQSSYSNNALLRAERTTSQKITIPISIRSRGSNASASLISPSQMEHIEFTAVQTSIFEQAQRMYDLTITKLAPCVLPTFGKLSSGEQVHFTTDLSANNSSLLQANNVDVQVRYEARPIGGILTVQVQLIPQFSGVGISNRPIASRTKIVAVDELKADMVKQIMASLSADVANDMTKVSGN
jgi:hypothetical protein